MQSVRLAILLPALLLAAPAFGAGPPSPPQQGFDQNVGQYDPAVLFGRDDGTWHPALRALPDVECVPTPGIAGWREVMRQLNALQED